MRLLPQLVSRLKSEGTRDKEAVKQIWLSIIAKAISVLSSLMIVPMTIGFINETRYGIWLTLTSVIAWISYFDFGLGNGFRNRFAEARANGNESLAKQYVSTTYFTLTVTTLIIWVAAAIINSKLDWSDIFNISTDYRDELRVVFLIVCSFFCINMIVSTFTTLLTADQKPGVASLIQSFGQLGSLLAIWILTKVSEGSLLNLAIYFSGVPCMMIGLVSIFAFLCTRYKAYRPAIAQVNVKLVPDIMSLGINFFVIYLCMLVIFQMMNFILSRVLGPEAVTEYNIPYKLFNVLNIASLIVITPFWSAFTDAYTRKDFSWMKKICIRLELFWGLTVLGGIVLLILSPWIYSIWIKDSVSIGYMTSATVMAYIVLQILGNIYMYMINGIGTIRIQTAIYVISAIIAWPLMNMSCQRFGVCGIVIVPAAVCMVQAVSGRIQLQKIMNGTAKGWWIK